MNLVDVLKQQLSGEVAKQLGGMAGASEGDLSKIIGSGLPGLLAGLGSLASTKEGAGKIANSIGGLDSSLFGNLAGMLGSSAASSGGSMLGSLFGPGLVDNLSASISKFTGVNQSIVKMILGYLTPMIMGAVGKSIGGKPDASSISKLFSDQKSNIAASVPSGFSLGSIQGFSSLANAASNSPRPSTPVAAPSGGGFGKLIVAAIVLAVGAGLYFFFNPAKQATQEAASNASATMKDMGSAASSMLEKTKEAAVDAKADAGSAIKEVGSAASNMLEKTKEATENVVDKTAKMASEATKSAKDAIGDLGNLNLDSLKTDFAGMFDGLTGKLGNITSAAGAEELLPDLKGYSSKLDSLSKTMIALPAEGKTMITELIKSQMDKINPILEKITGIPDIGETVLKVIEQIKDKLKSFAS